MKALKNLLKGAFAAFVVTGQLNATAQGTVLFNNRAASILVTHIYRAPLTNDEMPHAGNGANDIPAGTTDWTGYTPIGAAGTAQATSYMAVLLAAPGANQPIDSLLPAVPTFRTGTAAGQVAPQTATLNNVPADAAVATLAVAAWDNSSGQYSTWALARQAWLGGNIYAGISPSWNQDRIGGTANQPPNLINSTDSTQHLVSFIIWYVPEPSTFTLAGLGLVIFVMLKSRNGN